jgi:hypothetical protein
MEVMVDEHIKAWKTMIKNKYISNDYDVVRGLLEDPISLQCQLKCLVHRVTLAGAMYRPIVLRLGPSTIYTKYDLL